MYIFITLWLIKTLIFSAIWLAIGFTLIRRKVDAFYAGSSPGFYDFWQWTQFYFGIFLFSIFLWPWVHFLAPYILSPILDYIEKWRMKKWADKIDFSSIHRS